MKLKALSLACSTALAASAFTPVAQAAEGFEFNGYFRAAALSRSNSDADFGSRFEYDKGKMALGRLVNEGDDFYELAFAKTWELENGNSIAIRTRLGQANLSDNHDMNGQNIDGKSTGLIESYVEFGGLTSTGTFWGGQRYYGRDNYNFLTDHFMTDYSGTGLGVQRLELGGGQWDFAYLSSTQSQRQGIWHDPETGEWGEYAPDLRSLDPMHMVHTRAQYGKLRIDAALKYIADNDNFEDNHTNTGFEFGIGYTPEGFFGLGNGFSNILVQAGFGLSGDHGLGKSFTNYNAYAGLHNAGGQTGMRQIDKDAAAVRASAWGGWFSDSLVVLPWAQFEWVDDGDDDAWAYSLGVRPVFTLPAVDNFAIATEAAISDRDSDDAMVYKLAIAPTWSMATGTGPAPEIRVMAAYYNGDNQDSDVVFGVQTDVWW
ncbi:carbohydrate porin [Aliagarivorans taiwanensis]|uniref:carbohydrate porin n=1 Tax=Aliagarivorans taiwanensis TaxID=561966 RepID=UPI00047A87DE|nr:carbohydrate porin [Aliagarivorans taiwanensis]